MKSFIFLLATIFFLFSQILLAQNKFYNLEQALKNPEQVQALTINNPKVKELPNTISALKNLKELDLSKSGIIEFQSVIQLPQLKVLRLNGLKGIQLQELLITINNSKQLEELYLSNCELSYLPHQIGNFPNLKVLDLSNNNLRTLPYEVEYLSNLKRVNVSYNKLVKLNNKIINWAKLKELNIAFNDSLQQKEVFLTISYLSNLETLTIGGLKIIEESVLELQNVNHLRIVKSNFTSLPEGKIKLSSLQKLSLIATNSNDLLKLFSDNDIRFLEINNSLLGTGIEQINSLRGLKISNCSNLNLDELFTQLQNSKSLVSLSLISCGIEDVPATITQLKQLKTINLTRNNIQELPKTLANLKHLKTLIIKNNVINPQEIANLEKLNTELNVYWDFYDDFIVETKTVEPNVKQKKEIAPPLKGIDIPKQAFKVSVQEKNSLSFESGTSLTIPKNAFVDANGNLIEGEVDITFREFIDPIDFLVSGIPMSYDSAGVTYNFSSAGQIEFKASQNGQEVFPNPTNLIEVKMVSSNNDPAMNMYVFDEEKGNWEMINANKIEDTNDFKSLAQLMDSTALYKSLPSSLYQPPPIFYDLIKFRVKKDNKLKSFQINFNKLPVLFSNKDARKSFSQLRTLKKYTWIYDGKNVKETLHEMDSLADFLNKSYNRYKVKRLLSSDAKYYSKNCPTFIKNITLIPNTLDDNYLLTLYLFDDTLTLPVYPKITTSYPELEQRRNKQLSKAYNSAIKRNKKSWQRADKKYAKLLAQYEANYNTINRFTEQNRQSLESQAMVYRSFNLMSFGVYNCDQIRRMRQPKRLLAKLIDEENNVINPFTVFVMDKTATSVMTFNTQKQAYYDAASKNAILLVLKGDKVGLIDAKTFSEAMKNGDSNIKVKIYSNKNLSIGQLKSSL